MRCIVKKENWNGWLTHWQMHFPKKSPGKKNRFLFLTYISLPTTKCLHSLRFCKKSGYLTLILCSLSFLLPESLYDSFPYHSRNPVPYMKYFTFSTYLLSRTDLSYMATYTQPPQGEIIESCKRYEQNNLEQKMKARSYSTYTLRAIWSLKHCFTSSLLPSKTN